MQGKEKGGGGTRDDVPWGAAAQREASASIGTSESRHSAKDHGSRHSARGSQFNMFPSRPISRLFFVRGSQSLYSQLDVVPWSDFPIKSLFIEGKTLRDTDAS